MKIGYIYRSKELHAFSVENVFDIVANEIERKYDVEKYYLPKGAYSIKAFLSNINPELFTAKP